MLYVGCILLFIGIIFIIGMFLIGIIVGVIFGYFGGIVDILLMRIIEFVMLFLFLIFVIVLNVVFGDKIKNFYGFVIIFVLVIIVLSWGGIVRFVCGKVF